MKPLTRRQVEAVKELRRIGGLLARWDGTDGPLVWKKFNKRTWDSLEKKGYIKVERGDRELLLDSGMCTVKNTVILVTLVEW